MGYLSCKAESSIAVSDPLTPSSTSDESPKPRKPIKIQHFNYTDLEAATNGFSDRKLLGRGSHGLVYKAVLTNGRHVAVKKPSQKIPASAPRLASPEAANEFENEIDILSDLHGPNFVNLLGFTRDPPQNSLLVVEFMSNGTLYDALHSNLRPTNWSRRIRLAEQTARAIDTLHSLIPPVIHRDIKSANVLIDRNFNARLGDFGLALRCQVDDFRVMSTPPAGTMGYLDPGYVTPDNLSTKNDVFSFGILLLEIISGRKAIDVSYSPPSIVDWAIPLIRSGKFISVFDPRIGPPKDPFVRKQLAGIAAKCVRSCRERRPKMREMVEWLHELSKLVPVRYNIPNPCLMVETVGRPVELATNRRDAKAGGSTAGNLDDRNGKSLRNSRRVYSDLGLRNNLMALKGGNGGEGDEFKSKSIIGGFSCRNESGMRVVSDGDKGKARRSQPRSIRGNSRSESGKCIAAIGRSNSSAQTTGQSL